AIYQLLPPIVSSDYDIFDESSDMYPVDIYIDLYDWTEDDALAYEDAIDAVLEYDDFEEAYMVGLFYIVVYLEEELYDDPVYSINIYTYEGGGNTDPDTEFDGAELDQLLGASIYDLLPVIVSFDYEFFDESSEDYPIDIFIDLFD